MTVATTVPKQSADVARWLPDARLLGHAWIARKPRRFDRRPRSFKINVRTGRWCDFATGEGGDVMALAAYLFSLSQTEAAAELGRMLGLPAEGAHHG